MQVQQRIHTKEEKLTACEKSEKSSRLDESDLLSAQKKGSFQKKESTKETIRQDKSEDKERAAASNSGGGGG